MFTQHVFVLRSQGVVPQSGIPASVNWTFVTIGPVDELEPLLEPEPLLELLLCEPLEPPLLDDCEPEPEPVLPPEPEPDPLLCDVDPSSPWSLLEASSS